MNKTPDSILIHPSAGSVHSNWYNLAMAPAAQRYNPRYRVATITAKTGNWCDLEFDGHFDTIEHTTRLIDKLVPYPVIGGVQKRYATNIEIVYGTCNGEVFSVNDKVIVDLKYSLDGQPKVIGFYSNPKKCPGIIVPPPSTLYWPAFVDLELEPYANRVITGYYSGRFIASGNYLEGHYWQVGGPSEALATFLANADRTQIDWAFTGNGWINNAHTLTLADSIHSVNSVTDYYSVTMETIPIPPNDRFVLVGDNMVYWDNFGNQHQIGPVEPGNLTMPNPFPSTPPKYGQPNWTTIPMVLKYSNAAPALKNYNYASIGNFVQGEVTKWYVRYTATPPLTQTYP